VEIQYQIKQQENKMKKNILTNSFSLFFRNTSSVSVFFFWIILLSLPCLANAQKDNEIQVLSSVFGELQPFVSKDNTLQDRAYFNISSGEGNVSLDKNEWQCTVNYKEVYGYNNSTDVDVVIRLSTKTNIKVAMGIEFDFTKWSGKNYVMVPVAVYNGNRFKTVKMYWPTVVEDESDRYHDIALFPLMPRMLCCLKIN
jgi:hypothetical protein